ncbi:myoferlin-like [Dendronephthya gigantea]|uniref:myoferlin-like n=1 Tax=Dendronephthya gigantea TaxID=151771 RepID=UPI001069520D|nr:myoferlin-like [Dendronephthya gigantea]
MVVLQPGATAPPLENIGSDPDEDDIEANLLRSPGVALTSAVFFIKIYKAEDLPQMDSDFVQNVKKTLRIRKQAKDLVDPYCIVTFAGTKATSEIIYSSNNPAFNEILHLPFQFPSMCDRLKIQLVDWDRLTADDVIGTKFFPLSEISGNGGSGYLPCFGPCFVNLYGSTREFSDLPDEYEELNQGNGEGVAYRGRVLIELEAKLNTSITTEKDTISQSDVLKVQPFMRRSKFRLLASFLEATMLSVHDSPIEFEVSIGNYGNKLDNSFKPSSSTTPPTNPVFDGEKYYYLPWSGTKPCVRVDSHWEDITFRLGVLNKLLKACHRLEKNIELVKVILSKGEETECLEVLCQILDQLLDDCRPLPNLHARMHGVTNLDLLLNDRRNSTLSDIANDAFKLRNNIVDLSDAVLTTEGFLKKLQNIAIEPQNSMPDVIIWMLKGGTQRIAYCRIPAHELLYTPEEEQRGMRCGKVIDINLKYPGKRNRDKELPEIPALLRVMLWLGLEKYQGEWEELRKSGGDLSLFAETYENQMWLGQWTSRGLTRPSFSNAKGTLKLPKDKFVEPVGWKFDGSWFINPELSTHFRKDTGHKWFLEDAFQNEYRMFPGGKWLPTTDSPWTDINGETLSDEQGNAIQSVDAIKPPKGWDWSSKDGWKIDLNRAVDFDGWEYAVETTFGSTNFEAVEKKYHFCRRRRLVRERQSVEVQKRDPAIKAPEDSKSKDGWEFAKAFTTRFHSKRKGFDMVRRRRWHRKLIRDDPNAPEPVFSLTVGKGKDEEEPVLNAPRIFLYFKKPLMCQFRAHIYQARNLLPSDPNGLADPYVQLSFGPRSATSKIIFKKLNPTWDQMLVLENVPIYGHFDQLTENPPDVLLEIFDYDPVGKHDFLGRIQTEPLVFLPEQDSAPTTRLSWHKVWNGADHCGDILAAFELFVDEEHSAPSLPSSVNGFYAIPPEIRPVVQRTAVEVLCWGVRNLKRFHGMNIKSPIVEIEIGGEIKKTGSLKNIKKNPNFQENRILNFDVDLPKEDLYTPPITIRVRDSRSFGRNPTVGVCVIESARIFRGKEPLTPMVEGAEQASFDYSKIDVEQESISEVFIDDEKDSIDWWSKYYASRPDTQEKSMDYPENFDKIKIYFNELEKQFDRFQDFIKTFPLRRGKFKSVEDDEDDGTVGEFKGTLSIYSLPEDRSVPLPPRIFRDDRLPIAKPVKCTIRVYIVRAYDLTPQDLNGLADPYLVVSLGKQCFDDRENRAYNALEVDFGKVFEFQARIPVVKDLKVKVMDYDMVSSDDLIGETVIDLENRLLSLSHAIAGLPMSYSTSGPNKWRLGSGYTPTVILENYCKYNNMPPPRYNGSNLILLNGNAYSLDEFEPELVEDPNLGPERERLALHVLNSLQSLVSEHVETRDLMSSLHPGFSQGKLEMFVDIFPEYNGQPGPPIDISPRKPKKYELRVIVWNTKDVYLQESNLAGEKMSDIYVKCWMAGINKKQSTDTHYRSLNGEGMFNWRMIFPFEYMDAEKVLLVKKKEHFWSLNERTEKVRPQLGIQIWDNDLISRDDFIGSVVLDLEEVPMPFSDPGKIKDHLALINRAGGSLFEQRRFYGWWPVVGQVKVKQKGRSKKKKHKVTKLTGKVELTIELLESDEAEAKPAGKGQDEPNQHPTLKKPKRPETSFLWLSNPWKSFRFVIWRNYKWYIIGFIVLALILLLIGVFIYAAPGYSVKKLMKA